MTDIERNQIFAEKKQEIIDRLLGKDVSYPIPETIEHKDVDPNWNRGKAWYGNVRILDNMNCRNKIDTTLFEFAMRNNGGVVYGKAETSLKEEAPVIK